MIREIKVQDLNTGQFIAEKVSEIRAAVGDGTAINALSGGVDSSVFRPLLPTLVRDFRELPYIIVYEVLANPYSNLRHQKGVVKFFSSTVERVLISSFSPMLNSDQP